MIPEIEIALRPFERPVRVPAEVECRQAEPPVARAGERGRWHLTFVLSQAIPAGQEVHLLFDGGRNVKGVFRPLQVHDPEAPGHVAVSREGGSRPEPLRLLAPGLVAFESPVDGLGAGEVLRVDLGGEQGTLPRHLALPSKMFLLYLPRPEQRSAVPALNAEAGKAIVGACLIHLTGSSLAGLRVHAPSQVVAGEPFDLLVRGEDRYRNLACERPGELVVRANGQVLGGWRRADLEYAAGIRLQGLVLTETGVVRLAVEDTTHGLGATANPCRCLPAAGAAGTCWGMIHGHTELSDGAGSLDHYFTYLRDGNALDFGALGDHDHLYETSEEMWRLAQEATRRYHQPGRFVTFLGYEWAKWRQNGDGDRNVYYRHDDRPMYRSDDGQYPSPPDLFRALGAETALVIPHHSANRGNHCDFKDHDPERERLVEIFSEWGSSECGVAEGNYYGMRPAAATPDQPASGEVAAGFVQRALALGWRVGFTAGGDDHQAHPGDVTLRGSNPPRTPGLLAVQAAGRTREQLWAALYARRCYGTTGARILVDFSLDGEPMGSELWLSERPALARERRLAVCVHGTDVVATIEVVRNNQAVHVHRGSSSDESFSWTDTEAFEAVALPPAPHWATPFLFYYLRVRQVDCEMAWVSPIWVSPSPPA